MAIIYAPDNVEKIAPSLTSSVSASNTELWKGFAVAFGITADEVLRAVEIDYDAEGRAWFKAYIDIVRK